MSDWGRYLDDLADATARLLANGSVHIEPLVYAQAALAARDAVVTQLRMLVGAVGSVAAPVEVRDLTVYDVTQRPALALHQALSELPRTIEFGSGPVAGELVETGLPDYERAWQAARRATIAWRGTSAGWDSSTRSTGGTCCGTSLTWPRLCPTSTQTFPRLFGRN